MRLADAAIVWAFLGGSAFRVSAAVAPRQGKVECWASEVVAGADTLEAPAFVCSADINGDGAIDLVASDGFDDRVTWYSRVPGSAGDWAAHVVSTRVLLAQQIGAWDVEGDGDVDILSAAFSDDQILWHENRKGDGSLWRDHVVASDIDGPQSIDKADVDGDGRWDVFGAALFGDSLTWHKNPGRAGTAWESTMVSESKDGANWVVAADIDGDGDSDAVLAALGDSTVTWHANLSGEGAEWSEVVVSSTVIGAYSVATADIDNDGALDVVSGGIFDDTVAWHQNVRGDGSVWSKKKISTAPFFLSSVDVADVDGDQDWDVISSSFEDSAIRWFANPGDGGGPWSERVVTIGVVAPNVATAMDLDGDRGIEIATAGDGAEGVQVSVFRRIAGEALESPRMGEPANPMALLPGVTAAPVVGGVWDPLLDHAASLPSATLGLLLIGRAPANVAAPPYGTLLCLPPFVVGPPAAKPGAPFHIPVPDHCELVGLELFAQGVSVDGSLAVLTNALDVVIGTD